MRLYYTVVSIYIFYFFSSHPAVWMSLSCKPFHRVLYVGKERSVLLLTLNPENGFGMCLLVVSLVVKFIFPFMGI